MSSMPEDAIFEPLKGYLAKIPSITDISTGFSGDGYWWVKFTIDIEHPLAWSVVQELGHVLNYISLDERLPTVFTISLKTLQWALSPTDKSLTSIPKANYIRLFECRGGARFV